MKPAAKLFDEALREARLAEAAHLDALCNLKDAKSLRLDFLRDKILKSLPVDEQAAQLVSLQADPGETPRLLIDLVRSVIIAADGRSYLLEEDHEAERVSAFETPNADTMAQQVLKLLAHQRIVRERKLISASAPQSIPATGSLEVVPLLYVWLTGFIFGAAVVAAIAIYMGKLNF